jgi:hypothetical protein
VNGISLQGILGAQKRERTFEISLPAQVRGRDAAEREFQENTEISALSAQEAVLWLRSKVIIGAKIVLRLQVPKTSMLEKPLELDLSGTVHFVRSDSSLRNKSQVVTVRLDPNFLIRSNGD